jgi:hypothetical protein
MQRRSTVASHYTREHAVLGGRFAGFIWVSCFAFVAPPCTPHFRLVALTIEYSQPLTGIQIIGHIGKMH